MSRVSREVGLSFPLYRHPTPKSRGAAEMSAKILAVVFIVLAQNGKEVVYVPTEANLPILEAGQR